MPRFTTDPIRRCFIHNGKPFFYLADTAWCAFSHLSEDEFRIYAKKRAAQSFTVIQISALPLAFHTSKIHPFEISGGKYDFSRINAAYFDHAAGLCEIAREEGLEPCIHLIWVSYMPDSWGTEMPIPEENLAGIAEYMLKVFKERADFYSVSGDTRFESERIVRYYKTVLDLAAGIVPDALMTFHINPEGYPPRELTSHPMHRFASYQSGHGDRDWMTKILDLSARFYKDFPDLPIVNTEPCYEGIGHYLNKAVRFHSADIRRAAMMSLLTGGCAGISYGAHGVWQCRLDGMPMIGEETWGASDDIFTALDMPGACDIGQIRRIFESENLFGLLPVSADGITASASLGGRNAAYFTSAPDQTGDSAVVYRFGSDALIIS